MTCKPFLPARRVEAVDEKKSRLTSQTRDEEGLGVCSLVFRLTNVISGNGETVETGELFGLAITVAKEGRRLYGDTDDLKKSIVLLASFLNLVV